MLDEIQKVAGWSTVVKRLWDARPVGDGLRVLCLGSSAMLLQQGMNESLAGRFFRHDCGHWSLAECREAFGWSLEEWLYFGGYPGAVRLSAYLPWSIAILDMPGCRGRVIGKGRMGLNPGLSQRRDVRQSFAQFDDIGRCAMRKLLLGLGIAVVAVSGFAQGSAYVVYQGKLKGQVSPVDASAIAKYGDNVVLVVDTASDAAMMVRYGKTKATGPWVEADITTYRQDGKALNGKDDVQAGYLLSWYFVTPDGEHVRLLGQTKTEDAGFDWADFFAASAKWPKLQGVLAGQTSQYAAYASTSLKPLAALSQEMNTGDPEAVLAAYLAAKSKAGAQDVADEIAPFFPGAPTEYLVVDLFSGTCTELPSVPADLLTDASYKTTKMVFRRIPAGTFTMGSPGDELGRWADREFQHQVTLTQDFHFGVFEVTQAQYFMVMGTWPSYFENLACRAARPVEEVSWETVRGGVWPGAGGPGVGTFMDRLRTLTGGILSFDLPTEAQWEYACRAGTITALNNGTNLTGEDECPNMAAVGRYLRNGGSGATSDSDLTAGSAAVGAYRPNAWGLYDMHGNVWEWTLDVYEADLGTDPVIDPVGGAAGMFRVSRGGSWGDGASFCRSAFRNQPFQGLMDQYYGFRAAIQP